MNEKDIIDILFKSKDQIHFFWNFYVIGVIALTGWLISLDSQPSKHLKILFSVSFLIFMALNISGLLNSYGLFEAARADLINLKNSAYSSISYWEGVDFSNYKTVVFGVHFIVDVGVLILLWNDRCWESLRLRKSPSKENKK